MDYKQVSEELLLLLGGKDNITSNAACMTRLRVGVKDLSKVDLEQIKKVEGVLGVVESNTLQIVFGPGKVNNCQKVRQRMAVPERIFRPLQEKTRNCRRRNMISLSRDS